jgi:hypothetical protein
VIFFLSLLSKETVIVLSGIILCFGFLFDKKSKWKSYAGFAGVAILWLVLFVFVFKGVSNNESTEFVYSYSMGNLSYNLTAYFVMFFNFIIHPLDNLFLDSMAASLSENLLIRIVLLSFFAVLILGVLKNVIRSRSDYVNQAVVLFGLLFFVMATSPHIIFQDRLFMRYGYFSHAGLSITVALFLKTFTGSIINRFRQ